MSFARPLASQARIKRADAGDGNVQDLLVVATTSELDPEHKRFKNAKVAHLGEAAMEFIVETLRRRPDASLFQWVSDRHVDASSSLRMTTCLRRWLRSQVTGSRRLRNVIRKQLGARIRGPCLTTVLNLLAALPTRLAKNPAARQLD